MVARPHDTAMALRTSAPKVTERRFSSTMASLFATIETYKGMFGPPYASLIRPDLQRFLDTRVVPRALRIHDDVASILTLFLAQPYRRGPASLYC